MKRVIRTAIAATMLIGAAGSTSTIVRADLGDLVDLDIGFVTGHAHPPAGDLPIIDELVARGATVATIHDELAATTDVGGFDVLFISTSVTVSDIGNVFTASTVPIVTNEHQLLDDLAMAGPPVRQRSTRTVRIVAPNHPLAAGLSRTVQITESSIPIGLAEPASTAEVIATWNDMPALFAYEAGDAMIDDTVAAAPRIYVPGTYRTALSATDDYLALFVAAVKHAAETPDAGVSTWARYSGPVSNITSDPEGNVTSIGLLRTAIDVDPDPDVEYVVTPVGNRDTVIVQLDAAGDFRWAVTYESAGKLGTIASDESGNIFASGVFKGAVDFDPDPASAHVMTAVHSDTYLVKYDADGRFLWATQFESQSSDPSNVANYNARVRDIAIGPDGSIFTTGAILTPIDLDPDPDSDFILEPNDDGLQSMFVSAHDATGGFTWAGLIESAAPSRATAIPTSLAAAPNGDVVIGGSFYGGSIDFDPDPEHQVVLSPGRESSTFNQPVDGFVMRLNTNGTLRWVRQVGNSLQGHDLVSGLVVDRVGNTYAAGLFTGVVDFDPHPDTTFELGADTRRSGFVMRLGEDGQLGWAGRIAGRVQYETTVSALAIDEHDRLYIVGDLPPAGVLDVDLDPVDRFDLSSGGRFLRGYVATYDASGDLLDAVFSPGSVRDVAASFGGVYANAFFRSGDDIDPDPDSTVLVDEPTTIWKLTSDLTFVAR